MGQMKDQPATSPSVEYLQDVVLALQEFWAAEGCLLLPACDFAVPFATLHPDAFFGALGRESWRVAFPQPVRRPLDGRYGEHPYRLGKHLQLQVLLKPPPENVQALYLRSLEALGLDLADHDVRFSEWRWQPVSIGGRGSGWHALLDGLGVTRLTFLDRLADRDLDPPCVELSYGLERLAMTLQGAGSAFELGWSPQADYGALRRQEEDELTRYAFDVADPGELLRRLEALEREAGRCLEQGLARTAYELSARCLAPIDQLEARGELSARARADWLERVRARVVAAATMALEPPADARKRPKPRVKKGRRGGAGSKRSRSRAKRDR